MKFRQTPLTRLQVHRHLAFSALLAVLSACAGPRPAPDQIPMPGYKHLQEDIKQQDLSPLRHRRIVLDPGHGGHFRGAIGPNGLAEADVNLGVALNLQGLLTWAGAEVWLTRSTDTDFLSPADSSLSTDLAMRVSINDSIQPDVFISLHHNSTPNADRTINETQTYYPLTDDGASLDLARSIHRHLVLNLGITPASIRPGNFHVLRHASVPAVLGEPAMISHPVMAQRLSLAASQRLEAEAYFLGLLDYFSGGLPDWRTTTGDTISWGGPHDGTSVSWIYTDRGDNASAPGPDPAATQLCLDGKAVSADMSPNARALTWNIPPELPATPHTLRLTGRNLAGRATPERTVVLLPHAATTLNVTITFAPKSDRVGLHWVGANGSPLPRGELNIKGLRPLPVGPDQPNWLLIRSPDLIVAARNGDLPGSTRFHPAPDNAITTICQVKVVKLALGERLHLITQDDHPFAPEEGWRARLGGRGATPLVTTSGDDPVWLEGPGVLPLIDPSPGRAGAAGTIDATGDNWPAHALLPGLTGKIIVLDPAGGGTMTDGTGPLGLRGADLNLSVARHAAHLLRGAGAHVTLTRQDETALLPVEKVRLANRVGADLFLTIGRHAPDTVRSVRHHPGSSTGAAWALAAATACDLLPCPNALQPPACNVEESSAYLLRHTACPALEWRFDPPADKATELQQSQPTWQRAEARAILLATAAVSGHPDIFTHILDPGPVIADLTAQGGLPLTAVDWAQLDGNLPWSPLPLGQTGPGLPALTDAHILEVHAGSDWQVWLIGPQAVLLRANPTPNP